MGKIAILAPVFYPQKNGGGPAVSVMNLIKTIKDYNIIVISHNHEVGGSKQLEKLNNGWQKYDFGIAYYFGYNEDKQNNILKLLNQIKPDILYVNSFFSAQYTIASLLYKRQNRNTKVIISPRGELCKNALNMKRIKKTLFIHAIQLTCLLSDVYWHVTSNIECKDLKKIFNLSNNHIYNIENLSLVDGIKKIPSKKIKGELRMVFASRIQEKKNLLQGLSYLKPQKAHIVLDIYGPIENRGYWKKCEAYKNELPQNVVIRYRRILDQSEVKRVVAGYDVFFLPTKSENYGHAIVEALLVGTPVIISDQTPWTDINQNKAGFAISLDNHEGFISAINMFSDMERNEHEEYKENAVAYIEHKINNCELVSKYRNMFAK